MDERISTTGLEATRKLLEDFTRPLSHWCNRDVVRALFTEIDVLTHERDRLRAALHARGVDHPLLRVARAAEVWQERGFDEREEELWKALDEALANLRDAYGTAYYDILGL